MHREDRKHHHHHHRLSRAYLLALSLSIYPIDLAGWRGAQFKIERVAETLGSWRAECWLNPARLKLSQTWRLCSACFNGALLALSSQLLAPNARQHSASRQSQSGRDGTGVRGELAGKQANKLRVVSN